MSEDLEASREVAGGLSLFERGDEIGQGAVVDPGPVLGGGDGEADGEMGLTDAGWAEEDGRSPCAPGSRARAGSGSARA